MNSKTTSIFILGIIAVIFAYDALAVALGWHASISECVTNGLHRSTWFTAIFCTALGVLLGHFIFSVDYNKQ